MLTTSVRHFIAVAEHGSIRLASERLNISQSAISRRIQALEMEIGAPLFERHSKGVVLTRHGAILLASVKDVVADDLELSEEMEAIRQARTGHVRIAAIESVLPNLLPNILDQYLQSNPNITFDITIASSSTIVSMMRNGDADIGVTFSPARHPELRSHFKSSEPLLAVFPAAHPLAAKSIVTVADVLEFPIAVPMPGSAMRTLFDRACASAGLEMRPVMETNSLELLHNFVITGAGVTVLLRHTVQSSIEAGILQARRFREPILQGSLDVIVLRDRPLPPAAKLLLALLKNAIAAQPTPT